MSNPRVSAETLRRAAALMRERAGAATPGPWVMHGIEPEFSVAAGKTCDVDVAGRLTRADSSYVAALPPVVALAVADWLDATAAEHESDAADPTVNSFFAAFDTAPDLAALAVALAYLQETP